MLIDSVPPAPGSFCTTMFWPKRLRHVVGDDAGHQVDRAAGAGGANDCDRALRIGRLRRLRSAPAPAPRAGRHMMTADGTCDPRGFRRRVRRLWWRVRRCSEVVIPMFAARCTYRSMARAISRSSGVSTPSGTLSTIVTSMRMPASSARSCSSRSRCSSGEGGSATNRSSAARR